MQEKKKNPEENPQESEMQKELLAYRQREILLDEPAFRQALINYLSQINENLNELNLSAKNLATEETHKKLGKVLNQIGNILEKKNE